MKRRACPRYRVETREGRFRAYVEGLVGGG